MKRADFQHTYFMLSYLKLSMKEKLDTHFKNPYNTNGMHQLYIAPASLSLEPKEKVQHQQQQQQQNSYNMSSMIPETNMNTSNSSMQLSRGLPSYSNTILTMNGQTSTIPQNKFPTITSQYSTIMDTNQMRFIYQPQQHQQFQQQQQLHPQSFGLIDPSIIIPRFILLIQS